MHWLASVTVLTALTHHTICLPNLLKYPMFPGYTTSRVQRSSYDTMPPKPPKPAIPTDKHEINNVKYKITHLDPKYERYSDTTGNDGSINRLNDLLLKWMDNIRVVDTTKSDIPDKNKVTQVKTVQGKERISKASNENATIEKSSVFTSENGSLIEHRREQTKQLTDMKNSRWFAETITESKYVGDELHESKTNTKNKTHHSEENRTTIVNTTETVKYGDIFTPTTNRAVTNEAWTLTTQAFQTDNSDLNNTNNRNTPKNTYNDQTETPSYQTAKTLSTRQIEYPRTTDPPHTTESPIIWLTLKPNRDESMVKKTNDDLSGSTPAALNDAWKDQTESTDDPLSTIPKRTKKNQDTGVTYELLPTPQTNTKHYTSNIPEQFTTDETHPSTVKTHDTINGVEENESTRGTTTEESSSTSSINSHEHITIKINNKSELNVLAGSTTDSTITTQLPDKTSTDETIYPITNTQDLSHNTDKETKLSTTTTPSTETTNVIVDHQKVNETTTISNDDTINSNNKTQPVNKTMSTEPERDSGKAYKPNNTEIFLSFSKGGNNQTQLLNETLKSSSLNGTITTESPKLNTTDVNIEVKGVTNNNMTVANTTEVTNTTTTVKPTTYKTTIKPTTPKRQPPPPPEVHYSPPRVKSIWEKIGDFFKRLFGIRMFDSENDKETEEEFNYLYKLNEITMKLNKVTKTLKYLDTKTIKSMREFQNYDPKDIDFIFYLLILIRDKEATNEDVQRHIWRKVRAHLLSRDVAFDDPNPEDIPDKHLYDFGRQMPSSEDENKDFNISMDRFLYYPDNESNEIDNTDSDKDEAKISHPNITKFNEHSDGTEHNESSEADCDDDEPNNEHKDHEISHVIHHTIEISHTDNDKNSLPSIISQLPDHILYDHIPGKIINHGHEIYHSGDDPKDPHILLPKNTAEILIEHHGPKKNNKPNEQKGVHQGDSNNFHLILPNTDYTNEFIIAHVPDEGNRKHFVGLKYEDYDTTEVITEPYEIEFENYGKNLNEDETVEIIKPASNTATDNIHNSPATEKSATEKTYVANNVANPTKNLEFTVDVSPKPKESIETKPEKITTENKKYNSQPGEILEVHIDDTTELNKVPIYIVEKNINKPYNEKIIYPREEKGYNTEAAINTSKLPNQAKQPTDQKKIQEVVLDLNIKKQNKNKNPPEEYNTEKPETHRTEPNAANLKRDNKEYVPQNTEFEIGNTTENSAMISHKQPEYEKPTSSNESHMEVQTTEQSRPIIPEQENKSYIRPNRDNKDELQTTEHIAIAGQQETTNSRPHKSTDPTSTVKPKQVNEYQPLPNNNEEKIVHATIIHNSNEGNEQGKFITEVKEEEYETTEVITEPYLILDMKQNSRKYQQTHHTKNENMSKDNSTERNRKQETEAPPSPNNEQRKATTEPSKMKNPIPEIEEHTKRNNDNSEDYNTTEYSEVTSHKPDRYNNSLPLPLRNDISGTIITHIPKDGNEHGKFITEVKEIDHDTTEVITEPYLIIDMKQYSKKYQQLHANKKENSTEENVDTNGPQITDQSTIRSPTLETRDQILNNNNKIHYTTEHYKHETHITNSESKNNEKEYHSTERTTSTEHKELTKPIGDGDVRYTTEQSEVESRNKTPEYYKEEPYTTESSIMIAHKPENIYIYQPDNIKYITQSISDGGNQQITKQNTDSNPNQENKEHTEIDTSEHRPNDEIQTTFSPSQNNEKQNTSVIINEGEHRPIEYVVLSYKLDDQKKNPTEIPEITNTEQSEESKHNTGRTEGTTEGINIIFKDNNEKLNYVTDTLNIPSGINPEKQFYAKEAPATTIPPNQDEYNKLNSKNKYNILYTTTSPTKEHNVEPSKEIQNNVHEDKTLRKNIKEHTTEISKEQGVPGTTEYNDDEHFTIENNRKQSEKHRNEDTKEQTSTLDNSEISGDDFDITSHHLFDECNEYLHQYLLAKHKREKNKQTIENSKEPNLSTSISKDPIEPQTEMNNTKTNPEDKITELTQRIYSEVEFFPPESKEENTPSHKSGSNVKNNKPKPDEINVMGKFEKLVAPEKNKTRTEWFSPKINFVWQAIKKRVVKVKKRKFHVFHKYLEPKKNKTRIVNESIYNEPPQALTQKKEYFPSDQQIKLVPKAPANPPIPDELVPVQTTPKTTTLVKTAQPEEVLPLNHTNNATLSTTTAESINKPLKNTSVFVIPDNISTTTENIQNTNTKPAGIPVTNTLLLPKLKQDPYSTPEPNDLLTSTEHPKTQYIKLSTSTPVNIPTEKETTIKPEYIEGNPKTTTEVQAQHFPDQSKIVPEKPVTGDEGSEFPNREKITTLLPQTEYSSIPDKTISQYQYSTSPKPHAESVEATTKSEPIYLSNSEIVTLPEKKSIEPIEENPGHTKPTDPSLFFKITTQDTNPAQMKPDLIIPKEHEKPVDDPNDKYTDIFIEFTTHRRIPKTGEKTTEKYNGPTKETLHKIVTEILNRTPKYGEQKQYTPSVIKYTTLNPDEFKEILTEEPQATPEVVRPADFHFIPDKTRQHYPEDITMVPSREPKQTPKFKFPVEIKDIVIKTTTQSKQPDESMTTLPKSTIPDQKYPSKIPSVTQTNEYNTEKNTPKSEIPNELNDVPVKTTTNYDRPEKAVTHLPGIFISDKNHLEGITSTEKQKEIPTTGIPTGNNDILIDTTTVQEQQEPKTPLSEPIEPNQKYPEITNIPTEQQINNPKSDYPINNILIGTSSRKETQQIPVTSVPGVTVPQQNHPEETKTTDEIYNIPVERTTRHYHPEEPIATSEKVNVPTENNPDEYNPEERIPHDLLIGMPEPNHTQIYNIIAETTTKPSEAMKYVPENKDPDLKHDSVTTPQTTETKVTPKHTKPGKTDDTPVDFTTKYFDLSEITPHKEYPPEERTIKSVEPSETTTLHSIQLTESTSFTPNIIKDDKLSSNETNNEPLKAVTTTEVNRLVPNNVEQKVPPTLVKPASPTDGIHNISTTAVPESTAIEFTTSIPGFVLDKTEQPILKNIHEDQPPPPVVYKNPANNYSQEITTTETNKPTTIVSHIVDIEIMPPSTHNDKPSQENLSAGSKISGPNTNTEENVNERNTTEATETTTPILNIKPKEYLQEITTAETNQLTTTIPLREVGEKVPPPKLNNISLVDNLPADSKLSGPYNITEENINEKNTTPVTESSTPITNIKRDEIHLPTVTDQPPKDNLHEITTTETNKLTTIIPHIKEVEKLPLPTLNNKPSHENVNEITTTEATKSTTPITNIKRGELPPQIVNDEPPKDNLNEITTPETNKPTKIDPLIVEVETEPPTKVHNKPSKHNLYENIAIDIIESTTSIPSLELKEVPPSVVYDEPPMDNVHEITTTETNKLTIIPHIKEVEKLPVPTLNNKPSHDNLPTGPKLTDPSTVKTENVNEKTTTEATKSTTPITNIKRDEIPLQTVNGQPPKDNLDEITTTETNKLTTIIPHIKEGEKLPLPTLNNKPLHDNLLTGPKITDPTDVNVNERTTTEATKSTTPITNIKRGELPPQIVNDEPPKDKLNEITTPETNKPTKIDSLIVEVETKPPTKVHNKPPKHILYENIAIDIIESTTSIPSLELKEVPSSVVYDEPPIDNVHEITSTETIKPTTVIPNIVEIEKVPPPMENDNPLQGYLHGGFKTYFPNIMEEYEPNKVHAIPPKDNLHKLSFTETIGTTTPVPIIIQKDIVISHKLPEDNQYKIPQEPPVKNINDSSPENTTDNYEDPTVFIIGNIGPEVEPPNNEPHTEKYKHGTPKSIPLDVITTKSELTTTSDNSVPTEVYSKEHVTLKNSEHGDILRNISDNPPKTEYHAPHITYDTTPQIIVEDYTSPSITLSTKKETPEIPKEEPLGNKDHITDSARTTPYSLINEHSKSTPKDEKRFTTENIKQTTTTEAPKENTPTTIKDKSTSKLLETTPKESNHSEMNKTTPGIPNQNPENPQDIIHVPIDLHPNSPIVIMLANPPENSGTEEPNILISDLKVEPPVTESPKAIPLKAEPTKNESSILPRTNCSEGISSAAILTINANIKTEIITGINNQDLNNGLIPPGENSLKRLLNLYHQKQKKQKQDKTDNNTPAANGQTELNTNLDLRTTMKLLNLLFPMEKQTKDINN